MRDEEFLKKITEKIGSVNDDQVKAGAKESANSLRAMYDANIAAGFTEEESMTLVRDWFRSFTIVRLCQNMGITPQFVIGGNS